MGNGLGRKPLFTGLESPAIARNEVAASAGFRAFDARDRNFPVNRGSALGNLRFDRKIKINVCG
jgi:hypothetical protein